MSISFCEVAKKLTLPPKINETVMELYRCWKWSEGSRVAPLNFQNDESNSEMHTPILQNKEIFENSRKIAKMGQITSNFRVFLEFWIKIFGHYLWNIRYISEVKFLKQAHVYLLSYQIFFLSSCQLVFVK